MRILTPVPPESKQHIKELIKTGAQCSTASGRLADSLGLGSAGLEPMEKPVYLSALNSHYFCKLDY
ncbi:MAG: hypothetical protein OXE51_00745 [Gammaproteobacteria bacterium]|nr:hypothetical protein [Gammaproteobacteria bacterium]